MGLIAFWQELRRGPMPILALLSALGFSLMLSGPTSGAIAAICGTVSLGVLFDPSARQALLWILSPSALLLDWLLMILAMTPVLLAQPVSYVRRSSVPTRRWRGLLMFALGYGGVWVAVGGLIGLISAAFVGLFGSGATASAILLALLWSSTPQAQMARNACHRMRRLRVQGWLAAYDCWRQGLQSGAACVGTCWLWMVVPLTTATLHEAAMLVVVVATFLERLLPAAPAMWRRPPVLEVILAFLPRRVPS